MASLAARLDCEFEKSAIDCGARAPQFLYSLSSHFEPHRGDASKVAAFVKEHAGQTVIVSGGCTDLPRSGILDKFQDPDEYHVAISHTILVSGERFGEFFECADN